MAGDSKTEPVASETDRELHHEDCAIARGVNVPADYRCGCLKSVASETPARADRKAGHCCDTHRGCCYFRGSCVCECGKCVTTRAAPLIKAIDNSLASETAEYQHVSQCPGWGCGNGCHRSETPEGDGAPEHVTLMFNHGGLRVDRKRWDSDVPVTYVRKDLASPPPVSPEVARLREALANVLTWAQMAQVRGFLPDWACAECRPASDCLVQGFRCAYHGALALLASPSHAAPDEKPSRHDRDTCEGGPCCTDGDVDKVDERLEAVEEEYRLFRNDARRELQVRADKLDFANEYNETLRAEIARLRTQLAHAAPDERMARLEAFEEAARVAHAVTTNKGVRADLEGPEIVRRLRELTEEARAALDEREKP